MNPMPPLLAAYLIAALVMGLLDALWLGLLARDFYQREIGSLMRPTLLWQPALLVSTLKPQQNVVSVLVDDSQSMALEEDGVTRLNDVRKRLDAGVLESLSKRFQVRLYRMADRAERIKTIASLTAQSPATNLGESLKQVANETAGLPLGAVIVVSVQGQVY